MIWILLPLMLVAVLVAFWVLWPRPLARLFMLLERRRGRLRSTRHRIGSIDWHVLEGGHGEPLVLLHGFNGDAHHFTRVTRTLSRHFRIIAPDLPGFGETRFEGIDDFRVEAQADRVLALLDALGIERFYLGGSSMGGYTACAAARRAPDRVRALWLMAPGGLQSAPLSPLFEVIEARGDNALVVRDRRDFERLMDYCFVRPPWLPSPLARELADRAARHSGRAEAIFEALRYESAPLETLADGLTTPVLIIWGQADQVLHSDGLGLLAERMPNSRTLLLPDVGHLPMIEAPGAVAEAWLSFAESTARAAASREARQL